MGDGIGLAAEGRVAPRFTWTPIARTGDRFADFAPYAAAIDDAGTVAFQAALRDGSTGVFTGNGGPIGSPFGEARAEVTRIFSHPDLDEQGALYVYGELANGHEGVLWVKQGAVQVIADTTGPLRRIGPLGPTVNRRGGVAFRADTRAGRSCIFTGSLGGPTVLVADTAQFAGFQGLPVLTDSGALVFRADLPGGGHGIYVSRGKGPEAVAKTGDRFRALGLFPSANNDASVVFAASLRHGGSGVFCVAHGDPRFDAWGFGSPDGALRPKPVSIATIADANDGFDTFRGALINDAGMVYFYAKPPGGALGIYAAHPSIHPVLSIGDPLFGSPVVDLALNPVSINNRGQLAVRVRLANAEEWIVRADPAP